MVQEVFTSLYFLRDALLILSGYIFFLVSSKSKLDRSFYDSSNITAHKFNRRRKTTTTNNQPHRPTAWLNIKYLLGFVMALHTVIGTEQVNKSRPSHCSGIDHVESFSGRLNGFPIA